jgi:hypothetical protein
MGGYLGLHSEKDDVATVDDLGDRSLKVLLGAFGPSLRALLVSVSSDDKGSLCQKLIALGRKFGTWQLNSLGEGAWFACCVVLVSQLNWALLWLRAESFRRANRSMPWLFL